MTDTALVYDCFSGISGDMHLGAMLDLGVSQAWLRAELGRLEMSHEFELEITRGSKHGIGGTLATVRLLEQPHHHRHLSDITSIIRRAEYGPAVERRALDIFRHIAEAEAKIHDTSVDEVHFHEVGATDSIADVVAAALCLESLGVARVYAGPVEVGGGMVRCAHGLMPVPAPATAEILKGIPCRYGGVDSEATTPTGAAILRHAVSEFRIPPGFSAQRIGYGLGQKDFAIPNVLRVLLGRVAAPLETFYETESNLEIQCNIDDMPAEAFEPLLGHLFAAGAKDVFITPIVMKKSRPGARVSILCDPALGTALLEVVFNHSSTIGVRVHEVQKLMLPRESLQVETRLGPVPVKRVRLPGGRTRWKLEHDAVAAIAEAQGRDYLGTRRVLERDVSERLGESE
jgi:uncharacterized protein (TIGR00299 family) protein